MSEKQLCTLHQAEAVCQCLYHLEPMCDVCKYHDRHKDCPEDTLKVEDKIPDSGNELYKQCQHIYDTALKIHTAGYSCSEKSAEGLTETLRNVFKEFKSEADLLLKDVTNCIEGTRSKCKDQSNDVQKGVHRMLTDVCSLMKEIVKEKGDLSRLKNRTDQFQKMVDVKGMEERNCDLKSNLILELAHLLHPDRVLSLSQTIMPIKLIDCLYPPLANPDLTLDLKLDTKPLSSSKPLFSGCTILRTGAIVLVDKASWSLKLFKDNSIKQELKLDDEPFDITEKDGDLCVSFPKISRIGLIKNPEGKGLREYIINTISKCYGIEYGGGKLVVACRVPAAWRWSSLRLFCVYGTNNKLLRVVEKDRLGHPFYLSNEYFDFCPFRDEILFMDYDGKATRFNLTGPSLLDVLGEVGSRNGETLTAIRSLGNMKITCHYSKSFNPFSSVGTSTLRLLRSSSYPAREITFTGHCAGSVYFDLRSKKLVVVCGKDKSDNCYVYSIRTTETTTGTTTES